MKAFLTILCFFVGACFAAPPDTLPLIHAWSGQEVRLPFEAKQGWMVESEHGRIILQQQMPGAVAVAFPPLNGLEKVILSVDGERRAYIALFPERLLEGIVAECQCHREELETLGVRHRSSSGEGTPECLFMQASNFKDDGDVWARNIVLFTSIRDFPMTVGAGWKELSLGLDQEKGTLGIVMDAHGRQIDHGNGGVAWVIAQKKNGAKIIVLSPEFDLHDINNVLFLKKTLL